MNFAALPNALNIDAILTRAPSVLAMEAAGFIDVALAIERL